MLFVCLGMCVYLLEDKNTGTHLSGFTRFLYANFLLDINDVVSIQENVWL